MVDIIFITGSNEKKKLESKLIPENKEHKNDTMSFEDAFECNSFDGVK